MHYREGGRRAVDEERHLRRASARRGLGGEEVIQALESFAGSQFSWFEHV